MPVTYAFSARNSRVILDAAVANLNLYARRWSIAARVDELDVATFEEAGFTNYEDGLMDGDIGFDGFWSIAQNANANRGANGAGNNVATTPPLLYPGAVLNINHFYVKGSDAATNNQLSNAGGSQILSYYFPQIKLFTCNVDAEVRNTLNVSFSAKNLGRFLFPGQIDSANPRSVWR